MNASSDTPGNLSYGQLDSKPVRKFGGAVIALFVLFGAGTIAYHDIARSQRSLNEKPITRSPLLMHTAGGEESESPQYDPFAPHDGKPSCITFPSRSPLPTEECY